MAPASVALVQNAGLIVFLTPTPSPLLKKQRLSHALLLCDKCV